MSSQAPHQGQSPRRVSGSDIPLYQNAMKDRPKRTSGNNYHQRPRHRGIPGNDMSPADMSPEKIMRRYTYLCELHIIARRKLFENMHKTDQKLIKKLESNFQFSLQQIQDFKNQLSASQQVKLESEFDTAPLDTTYSENHNLDPKGQQPLEKYQITDPHLLDMQKNATMTHDSTESSGTMDDYKKYKNIL